MDAEVTLPQEKVREVTDVAVTHINAAVTELRRLFLVEDLVDSIKFGVMLWCLTYLGAWFNGMTILIMGTVRGRREKIRRLIVLQFQLSSLYSPCRKCTKITRRRSMQTSTLSNPNWPKLLPSKCARCPENPAVQIPFPIPEYPRDSPR